MGGQHNVTNNTSIQYRLRQGGCERRKKSEKKKVVSGSSFHLGEGAVSLPEFVFSFCNKPL